VVPPPKPPKRRRVVDDGDPPDEPLTLADLQAADRAQASTAEDSSDSQDSQDSQVSQVSSDSEAPAKAPSLEPELLTSDAARKSAADGESDDEGGGLGLVGWLMAIALCAVVGFFGWQAYRAQQNAGDAPLGELPADEDQTVDDDAPEQPPADEDEPDEPASNAEAAGLGLPSIIVQEGGYLCPELGGNLQSFLSGFLDHHAQGGK